MIFRFCAASGDSVSLKASMAGSCRGVILLLRSVETNSVIECICPNLA